MDQCGLVFLGEGSGLLVEQLNGTELRAVERGQGGGEPSLKRRTAGRGAKWGEMSEPLAWDPHRAAAGANEAVDLEEIQPAHEGGPAPVGIREGGGFCRGGLATGRERRDAACGAHELARLLGHEPQ